MALVSLEADKRARGATSCVVAFGHASHATKVKVSISASPMLIVVELTAVTVKFSDVDVFAGNDTVSGVPSFGSAPTATVDPSLKVRVPAVT